MMPWRTDGITRGFFVLFVCIQLEVDHVIVAVGLQPNIDLAKSARLEVDPELGGYRVNCELEARSDIWVVSCCV